jgi:hypothetical protein
MTSHWLEQGGEEKSPAAAWIYYPQKSVNALRESFV